MNDFKEDIQNALITLRKEGTILYPTDTIWGLGCDATSPQAVKKILAIKKRDEEKKFIILLDHESRLQSYVNEVPEQAWTLIEYSEKPLTIIFEGARNLPPELISGDGSIAIRITRDDFCKTLISRLKKPLVSTSANVSGAIPPISFNEINSNILKAADYVVKWRQQENIVAKPSTILKLKTNGEISFIRR